MSPAPTDVAPAFPLGETPVFQVDVRNVGDVQQAVPIRQEFYEIAVGDTWYSCAERGDRKVVLLAQGEVLPPISLHANGVTYTAHDGDKSPRAAAPGRYVIRIAAEIDTGQTSPARVVSSPIEVRVMRTDEYDRPVPAEDDAEAIEGPIWPSPAPTPIVVTDRWILWRVDEAIQSTMMNHGGPSARLFYYRQDRSGGPMIFVGATGGRYWGGPWLASILEDGRLIAGYGRIGPVCVFEDGRMIDAAEPLQVAGERGYITHVMSDGAFFELRGNRELYFVPLVDGQADASAAIELFLPPEEGEEQGRTAGLRSGDQFAWLDPQEDVMRLCLRNLTTGDLTMIELQGYERGALLAFNGETVVVGQRAYDVSTGEQLPAELPLGGRGDRSVAVHDRHLYSYQWRHEENDDGEVRHFADLVARDLMEESPEGQVLLTFSRPAAVRWPDALPVTHQQPDGLLVWDGNELVQVPYVVRSP